MFARHADVRCVRTSGHTGDARKPRLDRSIQARRAPCTDEVSGSNGCRWTARTEGAIAIAVRLESQGLDRRLEGSQGDGRSAMLRQYEGTGGDAGRELAAALDRPTNALAVRAWRRLLADPGRSRSLRGGRRRRDLGSDARRASVARLVTGGVDIVGRGHARVPGLILGLILSLGMLELERTVSIGALHRAAAGRACRQSQGGPHHEGESERQERRNSGSGGVIAPRERARVREHPLIVCRVSKGGGRGFPKGAGREWSNPGSIPA